MNCSKCGDKVDMNTGHVCLTDNDRLKERIASLQARIAELEYQLANYKAAADGTTHWCAECKMKDDRIAELEKQAVVWHKYPDEKPQKTDHYLIHCAFLNKRHFDFWHNDRQEWDKYGEYIIHWAYLPEPPR